MEKNMRRILVSVGFVLALLLVLGRTIGVGHVVAADATPTAGVQKEVLGQVISEVAPDRTLLLQERTFAPGSDSGAHPAPGPVVLYVESGSVTFTVIQGAATLTKYDSGTPQMVSAGQTVTLETGDTITYDQGVVHDVANPGTEPAVTIEARFNPTPPAATPTP
jgi:quercetin dioxygenase-like cupin family protein